MAAKNKVEKETSHEKEVNKQKGIEKSLISEAKEFKKEFADKLLKLVTYLRIPS